MDNKHLPLFGVGPIYWGIIVALNALCIILSTRGIIPYYNVPALKLAETVCGIMFMVLALVMWGTAFIGAKIRDGIIGNRLVTKGIYAWTRNPLYAGFVFACTGALLLYGNLLLLALPFLYWVYLTVLMKHTEEIWLKNLYGEEYEQYLKRVNRLIPWPPKKSRS